MATSTVPVVLNAIVVALDANASLDNVQVSYGHPGRDLEREAVWLAGTDNDAGWAMLGARKRDETYSLLGAVFAHSVSGTQKQATDRAFVLFGVVEDVLRANVTVSGNVIQAEVKPRQYTPGQDDEGRYAIIEFSIDVLARI